MTLNLAERLDAADLIPVPEAFRAAFAPAQFYLYEWCDYWLHLPEADCLRVGDAWLTPAVGAYFHLRLENRLGLTMLQPFAQARPLCPPVGVEVLSPKFPTPQAHVAFFQGLLTDLFTRAARLPFTVQAETARGVVEAVQPPSPLFVLHLLCQYAAALREALALVQAQPHRCLTEHPAWLPLAQAAEADAEVLLSVVTATEQWELAARAFPLAQRLRGYAPARVWQRRPEETYDTPENRFVRHFLEQVLVAAEGLARQPWWPNVPPERQRRVIESISLLRQTLGQPLFAEVGPLHVLPLTSQVLLRRDGYRELLALWQQFQRARRPLFGALQHAVEVRDVATLYETWVFFALVEELAVVLDASPALDVRVSVEEGLRWNAAARFGAAGNLVYNQSPPSYSVGLRPDFTWRRQGRPEVVLDAKFRLERPWGAEDADTPEATARRADLYKMHTYRDALGVRAAVALYPGDEALFYAVGRGHVSPVTLAEIVTGDLSGVGALPMKPFEEV